jgi:hypothetical protein
MGKYASSVKDAKDQLIDLDKVERLRKDPTLSVSENVYSEATETERKLYDEWAKLQDEAMAKKKIVAQKTQEYAQSSAVSTQHSILEAAEEFLSGNKDYEKWKKESGKIEDLVHLIGVLRAKISAVMYAPDDAFISGYTGSDVYTREQVLNRLDSMINGYTMSYKNSKVLKENMDAAEKEAEAAQKAADDYKTAHEKALKNIIEAKELEKKMYEVLSRADSRDITTAQDQVAIWAEENEKGLVYDFASMSGAQFNVMMREDKAFAEKYAKYKDFLVQNIQERESEAKELAERLNSQYEATLGGIPEAFDSVVGKLTDKVKDLKTKADKEYSETLAGAGSVMGTSFKNGVLDNISDMDIPYTIDSSVIKPADETLKINKSENHSDVTYEQGGDTGQGWADGILSKKDEVLNAVNDITSSIPTTYQIGMDQHSPSRVMATLGKFTILGLIKGLTDQTDELDTTTEGIATGLVNAFQNPFDTIAKIASGEIPYNPSIQPVLDTGYLATGVNGINSMFQSQQVELSGYSGQLAADISGVANQNDAIVAQLAQLREDMNDMTETILGMQIVLDSGAVVGELSDGFDYSLGVASTRQKRGN